MDGVQKYKVAERSRMKTKKWFCLVLAIAGIFFVNGCASTDSGKFDADTPNRSFKDYPDHAFDAGEYVQGMQKGGHNLLFWQDPSVDLSRYRAVETIDFHGRLLPVQNEFSYMPFIKTFNRAFRDALTLDPGDSYPLRLEGAVVECNPGSRAARYLVGMGAGKAACAVVCEVFEPGQSTPCIRIYTRDTASGGMFGGDSRAMLNHILNQLGIRVSSFLEERIGG